METEKQIKKMQEDNTLSIAEANEKSASVITINPSKIVGADGTPINLLSAKAVKTWLLDNLKLIHTADWMLDCIKTLPLLK